MAELSALAAPAAASAAASSDAPARSGRPRPQRRQPDEVAFYGVRTQLRGVAAKVLPGGYFVVSRAAVAAGAVHEVLPLSAIAARLIERLRSTACPSASRV